MNVSFIKNKNPKFDSCTLSNDAGDKAVIYPALGASLQELYFANKPIINNIVTDDSAPKLLNSSCSAILFPFANRINKGQYSYNNKNYQLVCNEEARGHAMHGLVYTQTFKTKTIYSNKEGISVAFEREYLGTANGFPFPFKISLLYTLKNNSLQLEVGIKNTGSSSFPFSLGWHPYFFSSNLDKSEVYLHSEETVLTNDLLIPTKTIQRSFPNPLLLKDQQFDDAFVLRSSTIGYKTPDYHIHLKTAQDNTPQFVQLYTPPHRKSIAIEPMTAAADCFNNNMGLKQLEPDHYYSATWLVECVA